MVDIQASRNSNYPPLRLDHNLAGKSYTAAQFLFIFYGLLISISYSNGRPPAALPQATRSLLIAAPRGPETIAEELIRLHREVGLTLVQVHNNRIYSLNVTAHAMSETRRFLAAGTATYGTFSPDGLAIAFEYCPPPGITSVPSGGTVCPAGNKYLATVSTAGSSLQKFPQLAWPGFPCWSYDNSRIALPAVNSSTAGHSASALQIFDLKKGHLQVITEDEEAVVTTQCWAPDGKRLVYWRNLIGGGGIVRLYDDSRRHSTDLAKGRLPSWSPDGRWISYLECPPSSTDCTYYSIAPSGGDKITLFHSETANSELAWSPDSRFVAYVGLGTSPKGPFGDRPRLWIRRLQDGAEDWFANVSETGVSRFQWIQNIELSNP